MAKKSSPLRPSRSVGGSKANWLSIFDKNFVWTDKDDVLDTVYWYRQVLALFMGIIWGYFGLTGVFWIISFVAFNSLAAYSLANHTGYEFDPDEHYSSVKEGFMTASATFLVTWIVSYTAFYYGHM